jgi:5'-methylthioadenosine phosphorylase
VEPGKYRSQNLSESRAPNPEPRLKFTMTTIGIIGGSGLYDMAELTDREERRIETPFGEPSAPYVTGTLRGKRVAFLARHGVGHRLLPSELNFRANIYGFKTLGVE